MAHKISARVSYRIDKLFPPPVGRLALASGATTRTECKEVTAKRYGVSLLKLQRFGVLAPDAPVSALQQVDWKALSQRWTGSGCSGSDWNQMRRAVSRVLTMYLGDKYHPLRRAVMEAIRKRREVERVPDLDVATFWQVVRPRSTSGPRW